MQYRRIGNGDIRVSEVGLGGEYLLGQPDETVCEILDCALENGVNILDLFLAQPSVRDAVGKAIRGRREKIQIQGHIGVTMEDGQHARTRDLNLAKASFDDLLRRLGTDYIDFGMIHYCDEFSDYNVLIEKGFFQYAKELKQQGIIRQIGMSSHNPRVALKAIEDGYLDMLMFSINPAWDLEKGSANIKQLRVFSAMQEAGLGVDPDREKLYQSCAAKGIGITVMKAFAGGRLLNLEQTPFEIPLTPVQCIHYALSRPGVVSVLPGVTNRVQLEAALKYISASQEEKDYSFIAKSPKYALTGKCMYCNHCRPCAMNIDIGMVTKLYDLAAIQPQIPQSVRDHYNALDVHADACIECGQCEPNCPFGVKIIDNMRKAKTLFTL